MAMELIPALKKTCKRQNSSPTELLGQWTRHSHNICLFLQEAPDQKCLEPRRAAGTGSSPRPGALVPSWFSWKAQCTLVLLCNWLLHPRRRWSRRGGHGAEPSRTFPLRAPASAPRSSVGGRRLLGVLSGSSFPRVLEHRPLTKLSCSGTEPSRTC